MLITDKVQSPMFSSQNKDDRRLHFFDKGESIPMVSQGVWQVYRGIVQLSQFQEEGYETLLGWSVSSTFFGLWLSQVENYQAKSLSQSYLKWFSVDEIEQSSVFACHMMNSAVRRLRQTEALTSVIGLKKIEDRLIGLLKLLKGELGELTQKGEVRLSIRFTHETISNTIGTTRVTVTRLMGQFQRQGLISLDPQRHLIIHI
jgi:CRP-like cAMP-binding protein